MFTMTHGNRFQPLSFKISSVSLNLSRCGKLFEKSSFYTLADEAFSYENFIFGVELVSHGSGNKGKIFGLEY
jgi:hypothetical protein